jgi:hypothetical protein
MLETYKFIVNYIMPLFILIPVIAGIMKYRYLTLPLKFIFFLMIVYAVINGINSALMVQHQQSKLCMDILGLIDFPMLSGFYFFILNRKWRLPIIIVAAVYVIFWFIDLGLEANSPLNIYPSIFESIFVMLYAIVYMGHQTEANIERGWSENSNNWVNSGLLIYFASAFLLFAFYNVMLRMHVSIVVFIVLWTINNIAIITEFILFAIGFNRCKR